MITALRLSWQNPSFELDLSTINNAAGNPVEVTSLSFA